jgi:uncharacterized alpha-E superfamily protein
MIARVADMCFWFGRYVERAESSARMLASTASLALDADLPSAQIWRPVIVVSGEESAFRERVTESSEDHPAWGDGEIVQRFMVWDRDNGTSLISSVEGARWNARSIREVLSLEAWEAVNELHLWLPSGAAASQYRDHREAFYQQVRRTTQLALGLLRSTMLHDEPLDFIWLGVLLERVSQTARMLDVHHHAFGAFDGNELLENGLWLALLRGLSGSEAYVKKSSGRIGAESVARFLISETAFPRSIAYCVHSAYDRLCHIRPPEAHALPGGMSLERLHVLDRWIAARAPGERVHEVLTHVVDEIHAICALLGQELFGGL